VTGESALSPEQLCGQLLIVGFEGKKLPSELEQALAAGERGGVVLFTRNIADPRGAHEIACACAAAAPPDLPPLLCVDQEGGRVIRIPAPALELPPMRTLGAIGDPVLVKRAAAVVARELAAMGFNMNLSPVLDVDSNPKNPVIGDRSLGSDPDVVARLGRAYIEGLQENGVMACGKHFPGHGDTSKDSHVDLPVVDRSKQKLDEVELPPFRTASLRGVAALMTAHVIYSELDPVLPATLSAKIASTLLRSEIGFQGMLLSDDLEMAALSDRYEIEASAVAAVLAGCDALLVCHSAELQQRAHRALVERANADEAFMLRCQQAAQRGLKARRERPPRPAPSAEALRAALQTLEAQQIASEIAERSAS
jgi:beta-N-acetylhexosaminidase